MLGFSTKNLSQNNEGHFSFQGNVITFQLSPIVHHFCSRLEKTLDNKCYINLGMPLICYYFKY